jgi:hypothetical protein
MAVLCPLDGRRLPALRSNNVIVGDAVYTGHVLRDRSGMVLPLTPSELRYMVPGGEYFRLTPAGQLFAMPKLSSPSPVKE